ncbi:8-demethylnovobiocic acid C(8)-methyltransferase [Stieleria bergensis]|uniref:8-demethylnovobiocic acid C(8)-methyltransferase n=2 Tax=Stieleria bergensis TaxID=2528025 RepID=A0A517T0S4_9BACT|nr:8-demethylnovobiocic acid C(8)-methyltransferase [Planctomycetes bacterium SV_7m_r]
MVPSPRAHQNVIPNRRLNMSPEITDSELPRTLEPETMDDVAEVQEYGNMDHRVVNGKFVQDLLKAGLPGVRVIDLGCGNAAIPVLLCQQSADVEAIGVDASIEMLEAARFEIEFGGVQGRISLAHGDCKTMDDFDDAMGDVVTSNTVLHHLAEPGQMLEQAVRVLVDGGRLFMRDLCRPQDETTLEALVKEHAGGESEFAQQLLRQSLHAALTLGEIRNLLAEQNIPAEAVQMTSDRHWTINWLKA